jgi:hypothetical protein
MGKFNPFGIFIKPRPKDVIKVGDTTELKRRIAIALDAIPGMDARKYDEVLKTVFNIPLQWDANLEKYTQEAGFWARALSTRQAPVHISVNANFVIGNPGWTQVLVENSNRANAIIGFQTHTNIYQVEFDGAGGGNHMNVTFSMGIQMNKFMEYYKGNVYARTTGGAGVCSVVELEYDT